VPNAAKHCRDTAIVSLTRCEGESGLLIGTGPREFGSARQAVLRRPVWQSLGSARERQGAVLGNISGATEPPTPPTPPAPSARQPDAPKPRFSVIAGA